MHRSEDMVFHSETVFHGFHSIASIGTRYGLDSLLIEC